MLLGASTWIVDLDPYAHCRVAGIVERLHIDPSAGIIAAEVNDGTGTIVARWPIRRPTPELAVAPGRAVLLDGMVELDVAGGRVLTDPDFQIARVPEVA